MAVNNQEAAAEQPVESGVSVEVNAPTLVTIFDSAGNAIEVTSEAADLLVSAHGFRRNKVSIAEAASNFQALFEAATVAINDYIAGVTQDGFIDTSDVAAQATAVAAMREIEIAFSDLLSEVARSHPVRQADPTLLVEQRVILSDNQDLSLVDFTSRKSLDPENPLYADGTIAIERRSVAVDPNQVGYYLTIPGFSRGA